jgi:aminoglycoside/choline kinase family phosphotransferase
MNKIKAWLEKTIYKDYDIKIASSDASFRKYYRLTLDDKSVLLMDSSLEIDSLKPFVDVTSKLPCVGVSVPVILEKNLADGFLIISDFGDTHYLNILNEENFKELYKKAMQEIIKIQESNVDFLPIYDKEFLHFEMELMSEWYLQKKLNIILSDNDKKIIEKTLNKISEEVLKQPQNVFVHRDFHSRNIMITKDKNIGVIDYQDAMSGAITYDLVSLLKDCYIEFKREDIESLVLEFRDMSEVNIDDKTFIKYFDFMGLQRHIKVLGIFSRLALRDKKDGYLKDIPLTLKYVIDTALRYEETQELAIFLQKAQK